MSVIPAGGALPRRTGLFGLAAFLAIAVTARERTATIDATDPHGDAVARRPAIVRYLRALARLALVLVPEYLVVVPLVGALRGWLLPIGDTATDLPVLVARALGARATTLIAGGVVACAICAGALLWLLGG